MKRTKISLLALGLLLSSAAFAQQSDAGTAAKAGGNNSRLVRVPTVPAVPVLPPQPTPQSGTGVGTPGSPGFMTSNRQMLDAAIGRMTDRRVDPELKSADGVIRIDFGIAKQGELFHTFFPFNIATLEPEETLTTPVLSRADYIRYSRFDRQGGVKDVQLTNGKNFYRGGAGSVMSGNGFDLAYQGDKPGVVDEMVQVYTNQGNIIYRLTGYILGKETELTIK